MDWVQIYFVTVQVLGFGAICHLHGKPRDNWSLIDYLWSSLLCLPYWGRVMGWW